MRTAIRQQLTTKGEQIIRPSLFEILSHKNKVVRYDYWPIRGTQYLVVGLGMQKGKRPDHVWSCVGSQSRTKVIILEPLMGCARDACSGAES